MSLHLSTASARGVSILGQVEAEGSNGMFLLMIYIPKT